MKLLIIADDYGLTDGVCQSIIELFEAKAISNTSVMVCTEGIEGRCQLLKDSGFSKFAGIHLQTTSENHHKKPLSDAKDIASLVDNDGGFKSHETNEPIDPDEIELEWEKQIIRLHELLGHTPSHMDSHHGVHRMPDLLPVFLKLAKKYNLPVRGDCVHHQFSNVISSTMSQSEWTGQNLPIEALQRTILDSMDQISEGVLELVTHPGFSDGDLIKSSPWNTVRENDHKVLMALSKGDWLYQQGIQLITWDDLIHG